jgi:glutathione S-transferase
MASVDTSLPPETTGAAADLAARHSADHPLKLYGGWFCPFVQRAWITLCEKSIPHQYIEINPYKKEAHFLAMNPRGLVPTLAVPVVGSGGQTQQRPLYESSVICEYLEDAYTDDEERYGPPLLPRDPYERARARLWMDHISGKVIPGFYKLLQHTPDKAYTVEDARREFLGHVRTLTEQMDPTGPWFLGPDISLVDISLAPWACRLFIIDHYKPGGVGLPEEGEDELWRRWQKWLKAITERKSVLDTSSDAERYLLAYKRYAEDTTNSMVGQATRLGTRLP